jgi:hypothetical protein
VPARVLRPRSSSKPLRGNSFGTESGQTRARSAASVGLMDEALKVMERLARIESLERDGCPAVVLLGEVRALLHEAEAWVRAEPGGTERAAESLDRSRAALAAGNTREEATA